MTHLNNVPNDETAEVTPEAGEVQIISKLSIATMGAKPRGVPERGQVRLVRVGGVARSLVTKENKTNGDVSEGLTGEFIGTNVKTGQEFRSGVLYLPGGIQEQISSQLRDTTKSHEIKFFIEIRAQAAANPVGYSYVAVPLYKPAAVDPLEEFREFMVRSPKAIAAPKA